LRSELFIWMNFDCQIISCKYIMKVFMIASNHVYVIFCN
jgi:hypothetical protein